MDSSCEAVQIELSTFKRCQAVHHINDKRAKGECEEGHYTPVSLLFPLQKFDQGKNTQSQDETANDKQCNHHFLRFDVISIFPWKIDPAPI